MIEIKIDSSAIEKGIRELSQMPIALKSALTRAAKRAGTSLKSSMTEETSKRYFIKPEKVKKAITLRYGAGNLQAVIRGKRLTLASYYMTPTKRPKTRQHGLYGAVKREGGIKFFPRGFLLKDGVPFHRIGKNRKDIEPLYSPAIPQIVANPENLNEVVKKTQESFIKNFNHEVAYRLGRFKTS